MSASVRRPLAFDATASHFDEIDRLIATIETWNTDSETVYLAVGEDIQALFRNVSLVREGISQSTAILASEAMTDMRLGLAGAVANTEALAVLAAERSAALVRLSAAVQQGASGSAAVLLVFRLLDYVVLIARAQVEGMAEGQDELGPFTAHVKQLVEVGTGVSRSIDARTQMLGHALDKSQSIGRRSAGAGTGLIDDFLKLIAGLEAQQRATAERRDEAHGAFTEIWKAIGAVVSGLQCHDMARQRLEHSIVNLARMADLERTGILREGVAPVAAELRPAVLLRIATLEIAQLDDLAVVYATKMDALAVNLEVIGTAIEQSRVILGHLVDASDGGTASLDNEAALLQLHFQEGKASRSSLESSLDSCVETTVSLMTMTGKLDELEHELKIAGLNAAVRAAHVKSGDETISYIARVICEQALIARGEADKVRQGIELAVAETQELSGRILPAIHVAEATIETLLVESCTTLAVAESEYAGAIVGAHAIADRLPDDVSSIRAMMTPHLVGCALMTALSAVLVMIAEAIPETDVSPEAMAEIDTLIAAQYTMAEERAVFASVVNTAAAPSADAPPADDSIAGASIVEPGSDADLDDIFF